MNTYSITDVGIERDHNEDHYANYFHTHFTFLVIADGMGGHAAGEVASSLAANTIRDYIIENKARTDYERLLKEAFEKANEVVYSEANKEQDYKSMGTTSVAAIILGDKVIIANVGDSRCYLWRDGEMTQLTHDHSLVADLIRKGLLTEEDAKTHPERSAVTRAIGSAETVEVDIITEKIQAKDKVLLCSDGLTTMLEDEEIAAVVTSGGSSKIESEKLIALANEAGGYDNITITLFEVEV